MSQQLGSNINSPLFMADPVPVRKQENTYTSAEEDTSFFVKGENSNNANNDSYEHIGGSEDAFIINSQGGSFQLHRKTLKDTLIELKSQAHVPVRQLGSEYTESFRSIVEALRLLYGSQALYDLILTDVREIFGDVTDIKPGTVAAFFIGCFNDDKFPGPMGCSPKCAASLPPTEGTPGYSNCDDLVLIYSDKMFSSLNEQKSTHAYIYISDPNFQGFTKENVNQLREAGIENASLIFGNEDGSYREVTSAMSIDQLPQTSDNDTKTTETNNNTDSNTNNGAGIAFAIIIIVIIILVLLVLYRQSRYS